MNTVLYNFMHDVPQATAIWLALMMLAVLAVAGMFARPDGERGTNPENGRRARRRAAAAERARLVAEAQERCRYAEEVDVAAGRAAATMERRRQDWLTTQDEAEVAWRAFEAADSAARRMAGAGSLPIPHTPQTPSEYADRERYLHQAVVSACWRGELSILELSDALAHRGGWDPRRHPVDQEVYLRRVVRDRLLAAHQAAADRERAAWQAAETAAVAARSLRGEATAAVERAQRVRQWREPAGAQRRPATSWRVARAG